MQERPNSLRDLISDSQVFLTGATGFVGGVLLERILRAELPPKKVFLLVRKRRGADPRDRVKEIFSSPLFSDVRADRLNLIQVIEGDVGEDGLGISKSDNDLLVSKCTLVFHAAAFISFAARLDMAIRINLEGSRQVLDLAKNMLNCKAMVYVSTAYANCTVRNAIVEEKLYPTPCDPIDFLKMVKKLSPEELEAKTNELIGNHPNTYTFTKQMAEALLAKERGHVALSIVRPSIVLNTWKIPKIGWVDNVNNGACGFIAGVNKGIFRTIPARPGAVTDMIPADMVVSVILTSALQALRDPDNLHVYHCTSGIENPVTWERYCRTVVKAAQDHPCKDVLWYPQAKTSLSAFRNLVVIWLFQIIPAIFVDHVLLRGKGPSLYAMQRKYERGCRYTTYFTKREWSFDTAKVSALASILPEEERAAYPFDPKLVDWDEYLEDCVVGMRHYFHKEPKTTTEKARNSMKRLKTTATLTPFICFFILWGINLLLGCPMWVAAFVAASLILFLVWV
ncbi:putative fatty acyl-CoA reductase CG5065 [Athalia rosae]|uniref:putative fatty acyl-CoA reductase CG5065 n=1 Tax=Athalia rosae TaxID=37344 RepID=UPI0020333540|nr:putative fatty acyl-CoA reductase CG5065 [Athalia rosae]